MPAEIWTSQMPDLTIGQQEALDVWAFMGSAWRPEVLPVALAVFPVRDVPALIADLAALREALAAKGVPEEDPP